jgi:outer membrane receptor protein involved in Fe transport
MTGYNINSYSDSVDFTPALGAVTQAQFGVPGTPLHDSNRTRKFTEELRLANALGQRLEWLLGAFYTNEDSHLVQDILVADSAGNIINLWNHSAPPTTFSEYAGFADLTYHITQKFDIQLGGRESGNRQTYNNTDYGPYATKFLHLSTEPFVFPEIVTKENSFTYLLTPRFRFSDDLMTYARLASGYRPGGPNSNAVVFNTPSAFKPDKTLNYEVGVKGNVLEHRLSFDASVYYIDWKDIQLNLTDPVTKAGYRSNASHAKSQGVELSVESRPVSGLTASGWVAFNGAQLTAALPAISGAYGRPGDRLPYSSRFSSNVSLNEEFVLTGSLTGFLGGSLSYVGDRKGVFRNVPQRQTFPAYAQTDLNGGIRQDSWSVNAYCTNVTDRRGVLTGGLGTSPNPLAFNYIQPRTVGLSVTKTFF